MNQLIELSARNFLGIKAVRLVPGDGVTEIVGEEGSGKTSVLRSIWTALGGAGNLPDQPIRDGESEADIYLDLGDILVTWRMERGKEPKLLVTNRDGDVKKKPQTILDALRGHLSFDPLAFDRLDDGTAKGKRAQAELLRKLAQLDTSDLDTEIARLSAEYTPVNTSAERMEAVAASVRVPEAPAEVGEERAVVDAVDVAEIAGKRGEVERQKAKNDKLRADARRLRANCTVKAQEHAKALEEIARLERALEDAHRYENSARIASVAASEETIRFEAEAAALVDPDTSAIDTEIAAARAANEQHRASTEAHNRAVRAAMQAQAEHVRAAAERTRRAAEAAAERAKADAIKSRKAAALAARQQRIAAAKFPVDGLAVEGDVVTWKGRPYSQINTSQRIPLCCSIGAALNPGLKFITIEHGNDIGRKVMPQIDAWARANGYRVLVERLEGTGASCVVIEDGGVRGVAATTEPEQIDTDW